MVAGVSCWVWHHGNHIYGGDFRQQWTATDPRWSVLADPFDKNVVGHGWRIAMMAFFWVIWTLGFVYAVACIVNTVCKVRRDKQRKKKEKQRRFESRCWQAKLRRETEPTGIVEHELNGHNYIAISHSVSEVPALYLSMRRMMMEVELEREISGKGGMLTMDGQIIPIRNWSLDIKG